MQRRLGLAVALLWSSMLGAADKGDKDYSKIPVGERVYIDTGNLWEPLKIVPRRPGVKGILDPNLNAKAPTQSVAVPAKAKPSAKPYAPKQLVFDQVSIKGRLSQPRVKFGRSRLPVGRVDERIDTARYERIFEVPRGDL